MVAEHEQREVLQREQQLRQQKQLRATQTAMDLCQRRSRHAIATRYRKAYQAAELDLDYEEMEGETEI